MDKSILNKREDKKNKEKTRVNSRKKLNIDTPITFIIKNIKNVKKNNYKERKRNISIKRRSATLNKYQKKLYYNTDQLNNNGYFISSNEYYDDDLYRVKYTVNLKKIHRILYKDDIITENILSLNDIIDHVTQEISYYD
jgi:hypothetical protein